MLLFMIKQIVLLGVFYLTYILWLRKLPLFQWNRYFILVAVLLACILPCINPFSGILTSSNRPASSVVQISLQTITVYANSIQQKEYDWLVVFRAIHYIGLVWGLTRLFLGIYIIQRIKKQSRLEKIGNELVYFNHSIESPFSFLSNIYIPSKYKGEEIVNTIIMHEKAHIDCKHCRDKIVFSILQSLCWFNPFIFLFHREIELQHEFEADDAAVKQSSNTDYYVEQLLQVIRYDHMPTYLAHHFFNHPLKSRITMLYKKSPITTFQKLLLLSLPLTIGFSFILLQSFAQTKDNKIKYTIMNHPKDTIQIEDPISGDVRTVVSSLEPDTVYENVDRMPEFPGGNNALISYLSKEVRYPENSRKANIQGKVLVQFVVTQTGTIDYVKTLKKPTEGNELEAEALRVIKSMPRWKPGEYQGKPVNVNYTLPIQFKLADK